MNTVIKGTPYILALDDEKDFLTLLKISLGLRGFEVVTSTTPEEMWQLLYKKLPDLIFLDIHMHDIDGKDICRQLKENGQTAVIPVIFLSANDNLEWVAADCGAQGFVSKPINSEIIIKEIRRVVGKSYSF